MFICARVEGEKILTLQDSFVFCHRPLPYLFLCFLFSSLHHYPTIFSFPLNRHHLHIPLFSLRRKKKEEWRERGFLFYTPIIGGPIISYVTHTFGQQCYGKGFSYSEVNFIMLVLVSFWKGVRLRIRNRHVQFFFIRVVFTWTHGQDRTGQAKAGEHWRAVKIGV